MAKRAPHSFVLLFTTSVTLGLTRVVIGCASDAGGAHGGDFGSLPELDGGRRVLPDGGILEPDGAVVAPDDDDDATDTEPVCNGTGTAAVLAGTKSALTGSVKVAGSRWLGQVITGGSANSKPSLMALGTTFIAATQGGDGSLFTFNYNNTWSTPAGIGPGGVMGPPTLAVTGTTAHVVYSGGGNNMTSYFHGIYDNGAWDGANDPVKGPTTTSFGTVSAGLAGRPDGSLIFVEDGGDNGFYGRIWTPGATSGTWSDSSPIQGAGTVGSNGLATPEAIPVASTADVVFIYTDNNTPLAGGAPIAWATHTPGVAPAADVWGTPNAPPHEIGTGGTGGTIPAATSSKMAVASLTTTSFVLSFVSSGSAYYTVGIIDTTGNVTWSAVAPIGGPIPIAVDSVAAVAKGICGSDIMFAFSVSGGTVKTVMLTGTKWSEAEFVDGAAGTNVAIATMP